MSFGSTLPMAEIPFVVEAWVEKKAGGDTSLLACINHTPATGDLRAVCNKRDIYAFGSGLAHTIAKAPGGVGFGISINVTTPYMPITSDAKAPDLRPFLNEIRTAVSKAVRKVHRPEGGSRLSQTDIVLDNLDDVVAEGTGSTRASCSTGFAPSSGRNWVTTLTTTNFAAIITDYEAENGEIPLMYREPLRHHLPPPSWRDDHARHADGGGLRAPAVDIQQAGLHRETGIFRSAQGGTLGRTARLCALVIEGVHDARCMMSLLEIF